MHHGAIVSTTRPDAAAAPVSPAPAPLAREGAVIWDIWLTYGAFYFCRTNISAANPGMRAPVDAGGLGFTHAEYGYIVAALKITYGLGQAQRPVRRTLLAAGAARAGHARFGRTQRGVRTHRGLLVPAVRLGVQRLLSVAGLDAVHARRRQLGADSARGRAIGLIGTGYQVTQGLTFLVAGWSAEFLGWRGAFYVPSLLLFAAAVFMLVCLEDGPANTPTAAGDAPPPPRSGAFFENVLLTVGNPRLWLLGLSLALLDACRYGYIDWGLIIWKECRRRASACRRSSTPCCRSGR
jgi:sugar phosphate permease